MDVLVVGGGIAGLTAARAMARGGRSVQVLEASDRVGGVIRTGDVGGALFENGPQGFLAERPGAMDLVESLDLTDQLLPAADAAQTRYVLHEGRLVALPMSPPAFLRTPLLSVGGRLRVLAEPFAKGPPDGPESVHAFASRRIGREAADVLVDAMVTGIFAGDPHRLSLEACFPKMVRLERDYGGLFKGMIGKRKEARAAARSGNSSAPAAAGPAGSKLHSMRDGMESLPKAVAAELGERVRLNAPVRELSRDGSGWRVTLEDGESLSAAEVLLTTPTRITAPLLEPLLPGVADDLRALPYAPVAVVGLLYRRGDVEHPLDGYGFLAPGGKRDLLGCLFESTVFPNRAPEGHVFLRAMLGGARRPDVVERDDDGLVERAAQELRELLGLAADPQAVGVWKSRGAIPQYDLDHPARLERLSRALQDTPGLRLGGASQRGVAVNRLVADAEELALP